MAVLFFVFALSAHLHSTWARNFLVADFFEPNGECDSELLQLSVIQEVGAGCIDMSLTYLFDEAAEGIHSYEILSCDNGSNEHLAVMVMGYSDKGCTGTQSFFTAGNQLSSTKCYSNHLRFSCQKKPISLLEKWPAVDIYFDNSTCQNSAITVSARPGCISVGRSMVGWSCDKENKWLTYETYDTPTVCADGVPSQSFPVPTEECLTDMIHGNQIPGSLIYLFGSLTINDMLQNFELYEGFYIARCNGY
jgi:hypothetical protein